MPPATTVRQTYTTINRCCSLVFFVLFYAAPILANPPAQPNILLIMADDLGFTDLGSFGSEITTPNLDRLATQGVRFSNFHTAATCSPTRAMLMSGTDNHLAGLGTMAELLTSNQEGQPGYEGYLNDRIAPLPSLLRDSGYRTYIAGKWHLGMEGSQSPAAKGFDRSFVMAGGSEGHLGKVNSIGQKTKALYREDGEVVALPDNFYSTRFYTEKLIEYLETDRDSSRPFFAFLSFTAPHWPLQAPADSIKKYHGKYKLGYDKLYQQRMARLKQLGLLPDNATPVPRPVEQPAWAALSKAEQRSEARKMEVYAAMVNDIDRYTQKLLDYLERTNALDNTLIIFLSDNGAEGHDLGAIWPWMAPWINSCCNNSYENIGNADSYIWYGPNWARVSNGPFKHYKAFPSEGGIRVPAFIYFPMFKRQGEISDSFASVMDLLPTLLEVAGTEHPGRQYQGRPIEPVKGRSMVPFLLGKTDTIHDPGYSMGWELFGKRAIYRDGWKITLEPSPYGNGTWQLFNLRDDPSEQRNLAEEQPEKLAEMITLWQRYARENKVILPDRTGVY